MNAVLEENILLKEQLAALTSKAMNLQAQLDWFKRQLFGKKSEKLRDEDVNQLRFEGFEIDKPEENEATAVKPHKRKKAQKGAESIQLPEDLPIEKHIIDLPEEEKIVNGKPLKHIGNEITSKLAYKPGSYYIKQTIRPKYETAEGSIATAEAPGALLNRCKADESFLADIIVKKYGDHLPLYRQSEILQRLGIHISRKLLSRWVVRVAMALKPLYEALNQKILDSQNTFVDETPVPMLKPGNKKTHQAYMWVIASENPKAYVYHFRLSRSHCHIYEILGNYKGNLHSDKYGAYENLAKNPHISWMPCMAHIRRKFFDSRPSKRADEYLETIGKLFHYEKEAKELSNEAKLKLRREKEEPLIDELISEAKQDIASGKHLPKSSLAKALGYLLSLSPHLKNYLDKAEAHLDNNIAERAIRPLAVGRKNWMFVGSEDGGEAAAILMSLVQSCRLCKINPQKYLEDVMRRIMDHNSQKLDELLPEAWAREQGLIDDG